MIRKIATGVISVSIVIYLVCLHRTSFHPQGETTATGIDIDTKPLTTIELIESPCEYKPLSSYGVSRALHGDSWKYVDEFGNILPYSYMGEFYAGLCLVTLDGRWGIVDANLNLVLPAEFEILVMNTSVDSGKMPEFLGLSNEQWSIINTATKEISTLSASFNADPQIPFEDISAIVVDGHIAVVDCIYGIPVIDYLPMNIYPDDQNSINGQHLDISNGVFENELCAQYDEAERFLALSGYHLTPYNKSHDEIINDIKKQPTVEPNSSNAGSACAVESVYFLTKDNCGQNIALAKIINYENVVFKILKLPTVD